MSEDMCSCDKLDVAEQVSLGCMGGAAIGILMIFAMIMLGSKLAACSIGAVIYMVFEALFIKYDADNKSISWGIHIMFTVSICILFIGLLT